MKTLIQMDGDEHKVHRNVVTQGRPIASPPASTAPPPGPGLPPADVDPPGPARVPAGELRDRRGRDRRVDGPGQPGHETLGVDRVVVHVPSFREPKTFTCLTGRWHGERNRRRRHRVDRRLAGRRPRRGGALAGGRAGRHRPDGVVLPPVVDYERGDGPARLIAKLPSHDPSTQGPGGAPVPRRGGLLPRPGPAPRGRRSTLLVRRGGRRRHELHPPARGHGAGDRGRPAHRLLARRGPRRRGGRRRPPRRQLVRSLVEPRSSGSSRR